MSSIMHFLESNMVFTVLIAGILFKFVWGKSNSRDGESSGEGETYLTREEQIKLVELKIKETGGNNVHFIDNKDGFDVVFEEVDKTTTAISIRKKEEQ